MKHIFFLILLFVFFSSCTVKRNNVIGKYKNVIYSHLTLELGKDNLYVLSNSSTQVSGEWKLRKGKIVFVPWKEIENYEILGRDFGTALISYKGNKLIFNVDDDSKDFIKIKRVY